LQSGSAQPPSDPEDASQAVPEEAKGE
jgi:hypothetical protein